MTNVAVGDGSRLTALGGGVDFPVFALACFDGNLYAGCASRNYTVAGPVLARWDGGVWHTIEITLFPDEWPKMVTNLLVYDGALIASLASAGDRALL